MALWLVRAGQVGEYEEKFLTEGRIYLCWSGLNVDLSQVGTRDELKDILSETYPNFKVGKIRQNAGQIWAFAKNIAKGDWVITPSKFAPTVHVAEVIGECEHHPNGPDPYFHSISVNWIAQDVPRANFDQDILYSLGAFLTICEIRRNDAESRVRSMAQNGWKVSATSLYAPGGEATDESPDEQYAQTPVDLEPQARDQIRQYVIARYKGHGMQRLVAKILEAQGYTVHQPPEGPDKGIDLLAAPGPLGFGTPRIVVQVKSQESPVDRPTLDQLVGTMSNVNAERGLLVCWGGFKSSVHREEAQQFFRVRLWDSDQLLDQIFAHYAELDDEVKAEIPLKHMWTLASPD
jgi:restriction system protein